MKNVIISNEEDLRTKINNFKKEGLNKIHVLADFDRTLTKAFVDGEKLAPPMALLRNGNYLSKDYVERSTELFEKYHPYEIDPNLSVKEKMAKMKEWWETHFKLLAESGLNRETLQKFIQNEKIEFRYGVKEFLEFLNKNKIPLVIISSSGIGSVIPEYLAKEGILYDNISVIANLFEFDEKGIMIKVKEPIIHSMNKSEITLKKIPIYSELLKRKNVLLLGDSLGDLGMIEGFDYDNLIKVGFLNEKVEENLDSFKKNFDVVLTNDSDMSYINKLVKSFS